MSFKEATSVAVDSQDRVYVFNRGNWPMIIFDADGNFLETWGEGEFDRPHGIFIDGDDNLYMADDDGHFVDKRTPSGEIIFRLGNNSDVMIVHRSSFLKSNDRFGYHGTHEEVKKAQTQAWRCR